MYGPELSIFYDRSRGFWSFIWNLRIQIWLNIKVFFSILGNLPILDRPIGMYSKKHWAENYLVAWSETYHFWNQFCSHNATSARQLIFWFFILTFWFFSRCPSPRPQRKRWSFIGHLSRGHLLFRSWQVVFTQFHLKVQSDCSRSSEETFATRMFKCITLRWSVEKVKKLCFLIEKFINLST